MTKDNPIDKVNPFADRDVTDQLNAWTAALEMAVATLNQTLTEFKDFQQKGEPDVGDDATGTGAGGEHGGDVGDC